MSDFRVPIATVLAAFGLPATVTRPFPDDTPVATTAAWLPPKAVQGRFSGDAQPYGTDLARVDGRKGLSLPRDANLPTLPRLSIIAAPEELGGTVKQWRVDEHLQAPAPDEWRVLVVQAA